MYPLIIVEDEVYLLKELNETVPWERFGFYVAGTAGNYNEAVALYSRVHPQLVVTDIQLPGGSGLDLLKECDPRSAIIITGHNLFDYAHQALRLGVVDFLLKPINDDELEAALRRVQLQLAGEKDIETTLEGLENPTDTRERHVLAAEDFIRRRYREDISLAEAAADLGLSESYLSRIIRVLRNRTFVEMLTTFRLQIATELLRDQRLRVGEVARLCGFTDQGYFARMFKRNFGIPPTVFRSRCQSGSDTVFRQER